MNAFPKVFRREAEADLDRRDREDREREIRRQETRLRGQAKFAKAREEHLAKRRAQHEANVKRLKAELVEAFGDVGKRLDPLKNYTLIALDGREGDFIALTELPESGAGVSIDLERTRYALWRAGLNLAGMGQFDWTGCRADSFQRRGINPVALDPTAADLAKLAKARRA